MRAGETDVVYNERKVCVYVRVRRKSPNSKWVDEEVKTAMNMKNNVWKDVSGAREGIVCER